MSELSLPDSWKLDRFNSVIRNIVDNRGKTPPLSDEGIELLEVNSISKNSVGPDYSKVSKYVSEETYNNWFRAHPLIGDILVPTVGTIGVAALIQDNRGTIAQNIVAIQITKDNDPRYWYYYVSSESFLRDVMRVLMVAIQPSLKVPHMRNFLVPIPPLKQQQKIATILSTVDQLIEKTQTLIDKYTAIKQGMMADLFTRGIDLSPGPDGRPESNPNYGQLRPPREQAPELYKETELGWVPGEWEVLPANEICISVIDCKNRTPPETEEGYIVLKTFNIKQGQLKYDRITYTDFESFKIWTERGEPAYGDVVITREAPIGESFLIVTSMPRMCLGQRMMLYRPNLEIMSPLFMYYVTRTEATQARLIELAGGSTVGHVKVGDIRDLLFFVPEIFEQEEISKRLNCFDRKISTENDVLLKLESLKKGLMQDLLTGKVKVR
ncbi:MAG: restriction endonuclease subunit S [Pseudomonadales bacterium]|nr:restriction endonuclease subunit S [Pseudomonadales bacterium]